MQTLNDLYFELVSKIIEDDTQSQMYYLSVIEDQRKIPVSYLLQRGIIFIPNNDYIKHYLGQSAYTWGTGFYYNDVCQWTLFATIPIQDLTGSTVGLVGWDAQNKYLEASGQETGLPMYRVSPSSVFPREKYFLSDVELLKSTFSSSTIFITDGVFDSIALNYRGIPAIALLGSSFSREVLYFLNWYRYVYVIADNDKAGASLYYRLKKSLPHVYLVSQNKTKDIEELLRSDGKDGPITKQFLSLLENPKPYDIVLK